jgi:hypothetical protein
MKLRAATFFAALLVGTAQLAWPDDAHAGFGRRGSAQSSPRSSGGSRPASAPSRSSASSGSGFGRSSGSYREPSYRRGDSGYRSGGWGGYGYRSYPRSWGYPVWGYGFGYVAPAPVYIDGQPPAPYSEYSDEPMVAAAFAGDLTLGSPGPLLGLQLSIEGERLGVLFAYTAAFAPIADTPDFDLLHLGVGHLTYAFIATERVRVRAEVGLHVAAAPLVTFVAPGAGLSAAFGLAGPLGLEARVFGNVWPYTQLDARAGLTLTLGSLGLGAGVRGLYLNDNGVLGGTNAGDTSDTFLGPYATLAIAL